MDTQWSPIAPPIHRLLGKAIIQAGAGSTFVENYLNNLRE